MLYTLFTPEEEVEVKELYHSHGTGYNTGEKQVDRKMDREEKWVYIAEDRYESR